MKVMGWLLVACVMLALAKLLLAMLAIALCILLLWSAINRPGEAIVILVAVALVVLAKTNPVAVVALIGMIFVVCLLGKAIDR